MKSSSRLARDAVHTAMRGYTGVCVGPVTEIAAAAETARAGVGGGRLRPIHNIIAGASEAA